MCPDLLDQHADRLPHQWITGDDELGRPIEFRRKLHARGEQYLLAVPSHTVIRDLEVEPPEYQGKGRHPVRPSVRVDRWIVEQPATAWQRLDVRDAEKGPLIIELLKHRVETGTRRKGGVSEETLVVIRYRDRHYIASIIRLVFRCDSPRVVKHRVETRLKRNQLARLYHWKRHNRLAPLNLERRRI